MIIKNIRRKPTIGLLLPSVYDKYQKNIWAGILDQIQSQDANILTFVGGGLEYPDSMHIDRNPIYDLINPKKIDVLILLSGSLAVEIGSTGLIKFLEKYKDIPKVSISVELPGMPCVLVDNAGGMREVVSHLIMEHNCKRIAFIKGPDKNEEAHIRFEAYKKALEDHNLPYDPYLVCPGNFEHMDGENAVTLLVDERKVAFDAIIGVDDIAAINTIGALRERKIRVPDDVKIVGFDDIEKSRYCTPPLTTVRQPLFELGSIAAKMAINQFYGKNDPHVTRLKTHILIRKSCGCDPRVFYSNLSLSDISNEKQEKKDISHNVPFDLLNELKRKYCVNYLMDDAGIIEIKFNQIIIGILESLNQNNFNSLKLKIENILINTYNKGLKISFWLNVFNSIVHFLETRSTLVDDPEVLRKLWNEAILTLYQVESRLQAFERITSVDTNEVLTRLGDKLISCFNIEELKIILKQYLQFLKINSCLFSLYETDSENARFIFYSKDDEVVKRNIIYKSIKLYPDEVKDLKNKSFVVLPLVSEHKQLGFILIEQADVDCTVYDSLSEKVASAIKAAQIMVKLSNHTVELERLVENRTRELRKANELLKDISFRDQLSGLRNRRFLMDVILPEANKFITNLSLRRSKGGKKKRNPNNSFAIVLIDFDYFKLVNDTYGHDAGDMVIKQVSGILLESIRDNDFAVRMGGEEFLLVLKTFNPEFLAEKIDKIRRNVEKFLFKINNGTEIRKTCSIGAIVYPLSFEFPDSIDFYGGIKLADKALYYAKSMGRNKAIILELADEFFKKKIHLEFIYHSFDIALKKKYVRVLDASDCISE